MTDTFERWIKDIVHPALPAGYDSKKHITCPNPAHPDKNPSFRVSFDVDSYTGIPQCTCDDGLNWHTVAGWLGVQSYEDYKADGAVAPVADTKHGYKDIHEYAIAHGVSGGVFQKAGWHQRELDGRTVLQFETQTGAKVRFLDGGSPSFRPLHKGYKACWYGLERAKTLANGSKPLVWCNGEPSVIVAQHFGIPAIATTGGEGNKFNELAAELPPDCHIWIVMDCDTAGKRAAGKAESALAELTSNVTTITLPLADKGDLADFCKLHGKGTMAELKALAGGDKQPDTKPESAKPEPEALLNLSDVTASVRERLYANIANPGAMRGMSFGMKLVDGMTRGLRDGNVVTVLGASGMGKSTLIATWVAALMKQAPGYIESTELGKDLFTIKLACAMTGISFTKFDDGNMNNGEVAAFDNALMEIDKYIVITPPTTSTPKELHHRIKHAKETRGVKWVAVDSLNKLRINADNYFGGITDASGAIQSVAQDLNLPTIVTSQTGRKAVERSDKRPKTNDGKGSGQIEEDSALLIGMYYHEYYVKRGESKLHPDYPPGIAYLYNLKDRWRGMEGTAIPLRFIGGAAFTDIDQNELNAIMIKHKMQFDDIEDDNED